MPPIGWALPEACGRGRVGEAACRGSVSQSTVRIEKGRIWIGVREYQRTNSISNAIIIEKPGLLNISISPIIMDVQSLTLSSTFLMLLIVIFILFTKSFCAGTSFWNSHQKQIESSFYNSPILKFYFINPIFKNHLKFSYCLFSIPNLYFEIKHRNIYKFYKIILKM